MPPGDEDTAADPGAAACAVCGRTEPERPATWSLQVSARGASWLCDACTRQNLRGIEGRLDEAWW